MEGVLEHITKTVDKTAEDVKPIPARVSALETRMSALERIGSDVTINRDALHEQKGWKDGKEDASSDTRATIALALSALAIVATVILATYDF
jgi:hypothetical protein